MIGGGPKRPWRFSLRLHRLESLCHPLIAILYQNRIGGAAVPGRLEVAGTEARPTGLFSY